MRKFTVNLRYNDLNDSEELKSFENVNAAASFYDECVASMADSYELERRSNRFYRDTVGVELIVEDVDEDDNWEFVDVINCDTYSYTDYVADHAEDEEE